MIYYHIIAFSIGVLLDLIVGDPYNMPHPIRLIGRLIGWLDGRMLGTRDYTRELTMGCITVLIVTLSTLSVTGAICIGAYFVSPYLGVIVESILTCYCLAAKSLYVESMKVYRALSTDTIDKARYAVSMIVGRDTESLDETGVAKAAIETVAENTSDGVIAPLIYVFLGGPVLGLTYKAINTMDSMIGYHNDRYEYFGRCAAKLDDIVNFIPARISAYAMIIATYIASSFNRIFVGKNASDGIALYDGKRARIIYKRDRYNHKSPNSAQTESVCAGALGIRLAGDASYFGKIVKKPFIGDADRPVEIEDIRRANVLMFLTEGICFTILLVLCKLIIR